LQLKWEISDNPIEGGEVWCDFIGILPFLIGGGGFQLNMLGEVHNKAQILNGGFIDGSNWVIDEAAGGKDGEGEDFGVVSLIFIEGTNSLGIDDNDIHCLSFLSGAFDGGAPTP